MTETRRRKTEDERKKVWAKTGGRCHFCARRIKLSCKMGEKGRWQSDHIYPKALGGKDVLSNRLPICKQCNRLRWYLNPSRIRRTFQRGIVAYREIKNNTELGKKIHELCLKKNKARSSRRIKR